MKDKSRKKKVFISYAREDQAQAEKIHQYLSDASFEPWMDVHDIVSGDDWLKSITRAIRQSDYFLALLSQHSVDKPGVLQEELDIALEICRKIPDPEIFLIPVRLEECRLPERISRFQWVNLFAEDGWVRLLRALHQERQTSRRWGWRLLVPLAGLLLLAGFLAWKSLQPPQVDPALYENACRASTLPLQVGFATLKDCPAEDWQTLDGLWQSDTVQVTPLDETISSSQEARSRTGYDLVVWGSCEEKTNLQFELVSSRKPDEVYEPASLQVAGTLAEVGDAGNALFRYQRGEYAEAASQFEKSALASTSPELALLRSNSLMFSGRYEDAISVLQDTLLAQAADWGAAYNNLGIARFNLELLQGKPGYNYSGLGDFDQAIRYAAAQDDTEVLLLAYANKSDLFRRTGNWEDAESACRAALRAAAQSSSPHICLALYKLSRFSGSDEPVPFLEIQNDLNNAKRYGPPPAKFHYLQAGVYRRQDQNQEALANYEHFLDVMQDRACLEVDWNYIRDAARYITVLKQ